MQSPNRKYLPAVDQLRAFAALLILVYHCIHLLYPHIALHRDWLPTDWPHTRNFFYAGLIEGHSAVSLFLVVSGFILTWGALNGSVHYVDFFRNRFLRLFPMFCFIFLTGANAFRGKFQLAALLTSLFQFGYLSGGLDYGFWTGVTWSVSVEAQIYLLFPAIRHYLKSGPIWALARIAALVLLVRLGSLALGADLLDVTYWTVLARINQFIVGAVLASIVASRTEQGKTAGPASLFPFALLGTWAALYSLHLSGGLWARHTWRVVWPEAESVLWALLVWSWLGFAAWIPGPVNSVLSYLGRISYSVYLIHVLVISIFAARGWYFSFVGLSPFTNILLTAFLLILPVVVAISACTYAAIEAPFLNMRRKYASAL